MQGRCRLAVAGANSHRRPDPGLEPPVDQRNPLRFQPLREQVLPVTDDNRISIRFNSQHVKRSVVRDPQTPALTDRELIAALVIPQGSPVFEKNGAPLLSPD